MSNVGIITSVRVWFIVVSPSVSFTMDRRYLPSYLGPFADTIKFLTAFRNPGLLQQQKKFA